MDAPSSVLAPAANPRQVFWTQAMYALHGATIVAGVACILQEARTLWFGLPSVAALGIHFLRRAQVRGTWLDSHFDWQLRTFAWASFWAVMATLGLGNFILIMTQFPFLKIGYLAIAAWTTWRAVIGWCALRLGHAAPVGAIRSEA